MKTKHGEPIRVGAVIFEIVKYVLLILTSIICLVPVVVCVFTAFKTE